MFDIFCRNVYDNIGKEVKVINISNNNIKSNAQKLLDELKLIKDKINNMKISHEDIFELHNISNY
jgi:ABC-type ATPase involved in cell division